MISLPKSINPKELINTIRELCWDVSTIFKSYNQTKENEEQFRKNLNIRNLDSGPVTAADIQISELIKSRIKNKYQFAPWEFLSEEDKRENQNRQFKSKWVWIIDPLDGTKDFINETGEYAMHLALSFGGEIIYGFVLIPDKNQLWISVEGQGTWFENKNLVKEFPIKSNLKKFNELKILTSKSHLHKEFDILLNKLNPKKVQGMGSIGFKISSILRGDGDLYISYALPNGSCPKDWDIAAPAALIQKAGGFFTDINGQNLKFLKDSNFDQKGILIASMNTNHMEICRIISDLVNN